MTVNQAPFLNFEYMFNAQMTHVTVENHIVVSKFLDREVIVDCYLPTRLPDQAAFSLLLINDGQDLRTMHFENIINELYHKGTVTDLMCIGIHCSADRRNEYATARILDYKGRGTKAALYTRFIFEELLPYIRSAYSIISFKDKSFAGFSLGGLSALDIVWNYPQEFSMVGVFSGSLWWRDKDQDAVDFMEDRDRIMHRQIREGAYMPWLKFFFEVGTMDETADRNHNGIIDSIDDTQSLINELVAKGYDRNKEIRFVEMTNGKHDVPTWAKAFPAFLEWGWGLKEEVSG